MAEEKTVTARVLRDYWVAESERVKAGSVVEVTKDALIEGIESGILERIKDAK